MAFWDSFKHEYEEQKGIRKAVGESKSTKKATAELRAVGWGVGDLMLSKVNS